MCPTETLVALKREAIFGQFLSLIQNEIRGSYRMIKQPFTCIDINGG